MVGLFVVLFAVAVFCNADTLKKRKNELSQMSEYELVNFNVDRFVSDNILGFDAFGNHYNVQLQPNPHLIPLHLHPANTVCHFSGDVIGTNNVTQSASISLSACPNRGIRGSLTFADGNKLFIKPSAYYFDVEYDKNGKHQLSDTHIVYKQEQKYDSSDPVVIDSDEIISNVLKNNTGNSRRRMMIDASKSFIVSYYVFLDPSFAPSFKEDYGEYWHYNLALYALDVFNTVSTEFRAIGGLSENLPAYDLRIGRLDIIDDWNTDNGYYLGIKPDDWDSGWYIDPSLDWWNSPIYPKGTYMPNCVEGNRYVRRFEEWIVEKRLVNRDGEYDMSMIWTIKRMSSEDHRTTTIQGLAIRCNPCGVQDKKNHKGACRTIIRPKYGIEDPDTYARTIIHETGHNFGAPHDHSQNGKYYCPGPLGVGEGFMGFADGIKNDRHWKWSSCSLKYFEDFANKHNGFKCLQDDDYKQLNYGSGIRGADEEKTYCFEMSGFDEDSGMNGRYEWSGYSVKGFNSGIAGYKISYWKALRYLYAGKPGELDYPVWYMRQNDNYYNRLGRSKAAYCTEEYLFDCRTWQYADLSDTEYLISMSDNDKFEAVSVSFSKCSTETRVPIVTDGPECINVDGDGTYWKTGEAKNGNAVYSRHNGVIFGTDDSRTQWVVAFNVYQDGNIICSSEDILDCDSVTDCTPIVDDDVIDPDCAKLSGVHGLYDGNYIKTDEMMGGRPLYQGGWYIFITFIWRNEDDTYWQLGTKQGGGLFATYTCQSESLFDCEWTDVWAYARGGDSQAVGAMAESDECGTAFTQNDDGSDGSEWIGVYVLIALGLMLLVVGNIVFAVYLRNKVLEKQQIQSTNISV